MFLRKRNLGSQTLKNSQVHDGERSLVQREEVELGIRLSVNTASEPWCPHLQNGIIRMLQRIVRTESGLAEHPAQNRFSKMLIIRLFSQLGPAAH